MKTAMTTKEFRFCLPEGTLVSIPKGTFAAWKRVTVEGSCGPEERISITFDGVEGEHQWEPEHEEHLLGNMGVLPVAKVPVLCGCGWGSLAMPGNEVPECCPVCGSPLAQCCN